jgi:hypothetical protein
MIVMILIEDANALLLLCLLCPEFLSFREQNVFAGEDA